MGERERSDQLGCLLAWFTNRCCSGFHDTSILKTMSSTLGLLQQRLLPLEKHVVLNVVRAGSKGGRICVIWGVKGEGYCISNLRAVYSKL